MLPSVYLSGTKRIEMMPVLATLLILNTTMISPLSRQNTWPCLISFPSLWKPPKVLRKILNITKKCLFQVFSLSPCPTPPPPPKYYVSVSKAQGGGVGERKAYMFSDGKVVANAFRLNIPSDPTLEDIYLFVGITLVIKHNSAKIALFLCLTSPPTHSHFLSIFNCTANLSNMLV